MAAALSLASLGGVTACGSGAAEPGRADENRPSRPEPTAGDLATIGRAEQLLVRQCMERQGFEYAVDPPPAADELRVVGFVLDDVAWAERHGYGKRIAQKARDSEANKRNAAYRAGLSTAERARFVAALAGGGRPLRVETPGGLVVGTDVGGCEAWAQEQLYGGREEWFRVSRIADNLTPLYVPAIEKDPDLTKSLAAWSACMRAAGHDYGRPGEARAALPELVKGKSADEAFATEVGMAVSEARCAGESGLVATVRLMEERHGGPVRAAYADEIGRRDRLRDAALSRARTVAGPEA